MRKLSRLIEQGESQVLDFKYCVSDSRKIAKTLAAFANTDGGKLLIGVRDNGSIAGVRSEEEFYMIDAAASLFCKPAVKYDVVQHHHEGKTVLEVNIDKSDYRPVYCRDETGRWIAYTRKNDQNLAVNRIILRVWKNEGRKNGLLIRLRQAETALFEYLRENNSITLSKFRKLSKLPVHRAEKIISDLITCGILDYDLTEKTCRYYAREQLGETRPDSYMSY
ncbi:MAG: putative DNA binding domain-containing protein [Bacteroidales bacterium]|nr:putative DNA binding domain-containing protein [Bacteroidales bacterium]